ESSLTIDAVPVIDPAGPFTILSTTCDLNLVLNPGEDCLVEVVYTPTGTSGDNADLEFDTSDGDPSIPLTGQGAIGLVLLVVPDPVVFSAQGVGTTSDALVVEVHSNGTTSLDNI